MKPYVSVVVPAYNEAESLPELMERVKSALAGTGRGWELIVVDDGSTDGTRDVLRRLAAEVPELRHRSFLRNYGKSAALSVGFADARGERIITMDADLQDDPAEFPALLARIDEGWDLVSGWKQVRHDPPSKTVPSKLFNAVTGAVAGVRLHDFNCGLKAYRAHVAKGLPVYGELHRYIPVLASRRG